MLPAAYNPPPVLVSTAPAVQDRLTEARQVADDLGLTLHRALLLVLAMDRCSVIVEA